MVYKSSSIAASGSSGGTGGGTVLSVTGLNTDNTDPANPVVQISVDGVTITGQGTPGSPLVSTASSTGGGAVSSVFGRTGAVSANSADYSFGLIGGVASVSQGGTGLQTLTSHAVLLGEGVSAISFATGGTAGRLLIDQGNADPSFQIMSGDAVIASTGAITLATVNANTGSFGSASIVPIPTVNGKGLITAISTASIAAPASLIIGTTLASNVTGSSLTTVGALASGSLAVGFSAITNARLANSSVTVSGVSGVTGGGTVALGSSITLGMAGNVANTLAGYNSSGAFSDVSIGSNLSLSGGVLNGTVGPSPVSSVFGRTGAVVAQAGDYGFSLISGTAAVTQGGTGAATLSAHGVLLGEGTGAISAATTGIAARILIDQGGVDPAFKALSGDSSLASTGAMVNLAINGVAYPASPGTNTVPVVTGSNQITYEAVPNAALANSAITIGAQTGLAGGGPVALGAAITLSLGTGSANSLAGYNSSGVFSNVSIGSNLTLSSGVLAATTGGGTVSSVFGRTGAVSANYSDYNFNLISGVASVSQGGTGVQTLSNHGVLLGQGTTAVSAATTGTSGRLLLDQGNADPAFKIMSGDATIASSGVISVGIAAITYNKIQNEAAYTILGNNTNSAASTSAISTIIIGTPGYSATGYNFAQISANTNNFAQLSIQNTSAGSSSSADFVATANDGDDTKFYVDVGINSSVTGVTPFSNPHAAYLYAASPELNIGAISAGGVINFYTTGGLTPVKAGFFDASQNLNLTNALAVNQGGTGQKTFTNGQLLIGNTTTTGLTPSTLSAGTNISITNGAGVIGITATGSAGAVSSISTTDSSLTISPNTGNVQINLNPAHANTWTATQTGAVSGGVTSFITTGSLEFGIFANGNSGAGTPTLKWENGNIQTVTITGACTLGFTLPSHPTRLTVISTMSATTGFPYTYAGTVLWPSGTHPTFSSISNAKDISSFIYDGTNVFGIANTAFS